MHTVRIAIIAALALVVAGCGSEKKDSRQKTVGVKTITVGQTAPGSGNSYVGTVEEKTGTVLSFEATGNITRLLVEEGQRVSKGQLLGTVSPTTLKDAHYTSQATLRQAQDAYRRMKALHDEGIISDMKWVEVETRLRQAEASERIAREQLSHTNMYAPYSGVITSKQAEVGMNVLPDQPVYKLADVSQIDVSFAVPEAEINSISTADEALVSVDALGGKTMSGRVTAKGVAADAASHTYNVKLTLRNDDGKLLPGMVCRVQRRATTTQQAIVIPMGAVELDADNTRFVWTVEKGTARKRNVSIDGFTEQGVRIASGLRPGDEVIVGGMQKVSDGTKVRTER